VARRKRVSKPKTNPRYRRPISKEGVPLRARRSFERSDRTEFEPVVQPVAADSGPRVVNARLLLNPGGFGFAEREDGQPSIFIPPGERNGAMDGDEVVVEWWPAQRGAEGTVRSVIRRHRTRITGVLRREGTRDSVQPDDPRVLGRADVVGRTPVEPGLVVVAAIVDYPDHWTSDFTVRVERALGPPGSLATEEMRILVEHGIDPIMPPAVEAAAESVPSRVVKTDREQRDDLTHLDFMTIDPVDARDFDDAVCVELLGELQTSTLRVHVAVADVSHYVRETDVFDDEAGIRCFSTYLPARVVPMLPFPLSAGICSLVPKKERCAMVVSFDLEANGRVGEPEVRAAVIRSRARLSYEQVATVFDGVSRLTDDIAERVAVLRHASDRLHEARLRRGAIELDLPEIKVLLDQDDPERVRDVALSRQDPSVARAYNLVEEMMVAANEAIGRLGVKHRLPIVYRVHDKPDDDRIERFCGAAELMAVDADPHRMQTARGFQAFLRRIADHPRRSSLHGLLLRTMAQAEYSTHNIGHFALASPAYAHFTSPIRRYPDLINHRVMKAFLARRGGPCGPEPVPKMPAMRTSSEKAARSSDRERAVVQAERDAKALLCAAYMRDRVGDRFEGTLTGLTMGGIFVTLDQPPVDGMVRRSLIERHTRDSFEIDPMSARMVGRKSGMTFLIGDRVVVEVTGVSLQRRQIDLALVGKLDDEDGPRAGRALRGD